MVVIDGKEYQGSGAVTANRLSVVIRADMQESFAWNKEMTVIVDNEEHDVLSLRSISRYDDQIRVEWECETEATRLEKKLEQKEEELAESSNMLNGIRDAIEALGTGIPTLSKLKTFLDAVKEAIHYG